MPTSYWIIFGIVAFILYIGPRLPKNQSVTKEEPTSEKNDLESEYGEMTKATFYGGPLDGEARSVPVAMSIFFSPYLPHDEDGNVDMDEATIIGHIGEKLFVQPNVAYYVQAPDNSYIYVRDLTPKEVVAAQTGGKIPDISPPHESDE
jgi:hypothetical protein